MNIFITNDDGIEAIGIQALAKTMAEFGKVYVVAPDKEYSGMSRSISIRKPLTAKKYHIYITTTNQPAWKQVDLSHNHASWSH